jgi:hypothetical protein
LCGASVDPGLAQQACAHLSIAPHLQIRRGGSERHGRFGTAVGGDRVTPCSGSGDSSTGLHRAGRRSLPGSARGGGARPNTAAGGIAANEEPSAGPRAGRRTSSRWWAAAAVSHHHLRPEDGEGAPRCRTPCALARLCAGLEWRRAHQVLRGSTGVGAPPVLAPFCCCAQRAAFLVCGTLLSDLTDRRCRCR